MINAAIGGMGNGRWVRILRGEVWGYHPRLVVLQFSSTDFVENIQEGLFKLSASDELIELPTPPAGMLFYLDRVVDAIPGLAYSHTAGLIKLAMTNPSRVPNFMPHRYAPPGSFEFKADVQTRRRVHCDLSTAGLAGLDTCNGS